MILLKQKVSFLLILVLFQNSFAQTEVDDIHYSIRKENIKIIDHINGYKSQVELKGKFISNNSHIEQIVYSELEEISNIDPKYYNSQNKLKHLKESRTDNSSLISSSFYDGYRTYLIDFNKKGEQFEISYDLQCKELMHLSHLMANSYIPTDTFLYTIEVPHTYQFFLQRNSLNNIFLFDSIISTNHTTYKLIIIPNQKLKKSRQTNRYELNDFSNASIRIVIIPTEYSKKPWSYFNLWYNSIVAKQETLSEKTFSEIDTQIIKKLSTTDSIPIAIFNYVKSKIAYLDIENGIGAFQPRNPNDIFNKKQGDCKDMSNLIYQLLKRYKYDVHLAISSTLSHDFDLDFPCLSSANHVIAVLKTDDMYIYLDATDSECKYGFPSSHIQGKNIFIIDDKDGELKKVEIVPAIKNLIHSTLQLSKKGNQLQGKFESNYYGLSETELQNVKNRFNKLDYSNYISSKLKTMFNNSSFDSIKTITYNDRTQVSTILTNQKNIIKNEAKTIIFLKTLPFPHTFPKEINKENKFTTYQTHLNKIECVIEVDQNKISLNQFTPIKYDKNGFLFEFNVQQIAANKIQISYQYECSKVLFNQTDIETFNELNKLINKTLNFTISYE